MPSHHSAEGKSGNTKFSFAEALCTSGTDDKFSNYSSVEIDNQMAVEKTVVIFTYADSFQNFRDLY